MLKPKAVDTVGLVKLRHDLLRATKTAAMTEIGTGVERAASAKDPKLAAIGVSHSRAMWTRRTCLSTGSRPSATTGNL